MIIYNVDVVEIMRNVARTRRETFAKFVLKDVEALNTEARSGKIGNHWVSVGIENVDVDAPLDVETRDRLALAVAEFQAHFPAGTRFTHEVEPVVETVPAQLTLTSRPCLGVTESGVQIGGKNKWARFTKN